MTTTARINFETSLDLKKSIKVFTTQHNITIKEFFEELAIEKLAQYNNDVQPLTKEEEAIMNETFDFFSNRNEKILSSRELSDIAEQVRNGGDLSKLLKMDYIND